MNPRSTIQILPRMNIICNDTITFPLLSRGVHSVIKIYEIGTVTPNKIPYETLNASIYHKFWANAVSSTVKNYHS